MPNSKPSTSIDESYHKLIRQLAADQDYRALLVELLAVIHRDGGQYTQLAGFAVSVEDAIDTYHELRAACNLLADRLRRLGKGEPNATQEGQKPEGR